jgi:hypothetical protein
MTRQNKSQKGATKGQIVLVAVLGVILIAVLASNFSSTDGEVAASAPAEGDDQPTATTPAGAAMPSSNPNPFGAFAEDQNWARPATIDLVKFDPMSDGSRHDEPVAPQYNAEEINELRNAQDAIVFSSEGQTVARIGSKEFHVGDVVGGLEIREISSAGIVLGEPQ